jgi:Arc/MetJ-type ribon-helix-helix transcriptional regulator
MTIHVKLETEKLVREALQNGRFGSVDEIIVEGVRSRLEKPMPSNGKARKTPAEAVAHIRELRKGNRLPAGVTIKDLINEGRA